MHTNEGIVATLREAFEAVVDELTPDIEPALVYVLNGQSPDEPTAEVHDPA
jgi:hypothetical protein